MIRKAPPFEAIEIFVAVAHGQSFRAVARDMALSPSAVSRRIARLEAFLGVQLFERTPATVSLTAAGRSYFEAVAPALRAILEAGDRLPSATERPLRVATSHSFAAWLTPHLPGLARDRGFEIDLVLSRDFGVLRSGEADFAIWGGLSCPFDLVSEPLFDVVAAPVAAARLADGRAPPISPSALADYPLLTVRSSPDMWRQWFEAVGVAPASTPPRRFDTIQLMYEAAAAGMGVALAIPLLADAYMQGGKLAVCAGPSCALDSGYALYWRPVRPGVVRAEARFLDWLRQETARGLADFAARSAADRRAAA